MLALTCMCSCFVVTKYTGLHVAPLVSLFRRHCRIAASVKPSMGIHVTYFNNHIVSYIIDKDGLYRSEGHATTDSWTDEIMDHVDAHLHHYQHIYMEKRRPKMTTTLLN